MFHCKQKNNSIAAANSALGGNVTMFLRDSGESTIAARGRTSDAGRIAAMLSGMFQFMEDSHQAERWYDFFQELPCPKETKSIFVRRAEIVLKRCQVHGSLLVM